MDTLTQYPIFQQILIHSLIKSYSKNEFGAFVCMWKLIVQFFRHVQRPLSCCKYRCPAHYCYPFMNTNFDKEVAHNIMSIN